MSSDTDPIFVTGNEGFFMIEKHPLLKCALSSICCNDFCLVHMLSVSIHLKTVDTLGIVIGVERDIIGRNPCILW